MDKKNLNNEIIYILKQRILREGLVLSRGEEEEARLRQWLSPKSPEEESPVEKPCQSMTELIQGCGACAMGREKKNPIGSGENGVMIILNSPRLLNKVEKEVFKKDSAELLKKIITAINLHIEECYITNVVKCDIEDPLMKLSQIVKNCEALLVKELECIKPRIAIVFGDIIPLQRIIKESRGISWFNIDHPITLIKNPDLKKKAWNTLKVVMEEYGKDHRS